MENIELKNWFEKEIESLRKRVDEKFSKVLNINIGGIYKDPRTEFICKVVDIEVDCVYGYGLDMLGNWVNRSDKSNVSFCVPSDNIIKASEEEWKSALIKEAERRGFKEGCSYKGLSEFQYNNCTNISYSYKYATDSLTIHCSSFGLHTSGSGFNPIYSQGKWAEIVKEEPIKICGKEVRFHDAKSTNGDLACIAIEGKRYSRNELKVLERIMSMGQIQSLNVGCNGQEKVTLETIEKILSKF